MFRWSETNCQNFLLIHVNTPTLFNSSQKKAQKMKWEINILLEDKKVNSFTVQIYIANITIFLSVLLSSREISTSRVTFYFKLNSS